MADPKFTRHARIRQEQRNISTATVLQTIQGDEPATEAIKGDSAVTEVYNGDIKVVVGEDQTVVTVVDNGRNTQYDVLRRSSSRENALIDRIRRRPNDDHALCSLGDLKLSGELGPVSTTEAFELYKRAADLGSGHAMIKIGMMYLEGVLKVPGNVEDEDVLLQNNAEAMFWLEKSAEKNNKAGMSFLGQELCLKAARMPDSEEKSAMKEKALYYLEKASRMNASRATYRLAEIYELGLFGEKDIKKAMEIYLKAAKTGSPGSIEKMYKFYKMGLYDGVEFEELFDSVIRSWTRNSIGLAYEKGVDTCQGVLGGIPVKGVHMLEMAAERGHVDAMKEVAKVYSQWGQLRNGLKLAQHWNYELFRLIRKSAQTRNLKSLWHLGKMHLKGKTGKFSLKEAETCLRVAAEGMNNIDYLLDLAEYYKTGRLGNVEPEVGNVYIEKAIQLAEKEGEESHFERLVGIYSMSRWIKRDFIKAYGWLESHNAGDIGDWVMAEIYLHHQSPLRDVEKGKEKILLNIAESSMILINVFTDHWSVLKDDLKRMASLPNAGLAKRRALRLLATHEKNKGPYYNELLKNFNDFTSGEKLLDIHSREKLPNDHLETLKSWGNELRGSFALKALLPLYLLHKNGILSADQSEELKVFLCYSATYKKSLEDLKRHLVKYKNVKNRALEELNRELEDLQCEETRDKSEEESYRRMSRVLGDIYQADSQLDEAVKWYEKSSKVNNSIASYRLGRIHERNRDLSQAIEWFTRGALLGNKDALDSLKGLYHSGDFTNERFLKRFVHDSIVNDSIVARTNPLYDLKTYPKTSEEMYQEAMRRLELRSEQEKHLGVFWLRKAIRHSGCREHLKSSVELFRLYSTGQMGDRVKSIARQHQFAVYKYISKRLNRVTPREDLRRFSTALEAMPKKKYFRRLEKKIKKLSGKFKGRTIVLAKSLDSYKFLMPF